MSGSLTSSRTTAGRWRLAYSRADPPSAASATTAKPFASSTRRARDLNPALSSTKRTAVATPESSTKSRISAMEPAATGASVLRHRSAGCPIGTRRPNWHGRQTNSNRHGGFQMRTRLLLLTGITAALLMAPAIAGAATITVNTTDDVNAAQCTLRDAITAANGDAATGGCVKGNGPDTIVFSVPPAGTITLGMSLPAIQDSVDIQGPGASQLTVDGAGSVRIFDIAQGSVGISGVTIAHARCIEGCGIRNYSTLTLDHVVVDHNISTNSGGMNAFTDGAGIYNAGTLTLKLSSVSNNTAVASGASSQNVPQGAAIYNTKFGSATIEHSTLNGNTATAVGAGGTSTNARGGAIANGGILNVTQSTIAANSVDATGAVGGNSAHGGGIANTNSPDVHVTLDRT